MTPLERYQQSEGGKARLESQSKEERSFQAMLAASRRPLLNDVNKSSEQILKDFRELEESYKWLYLYIVGPDRSKIEHRTSDGAILRQVKAFAGGPIGFLGLSLFGSERPALQVFYKPLRKGTEVIEDLRREGREVLALAVEALHKATLPELKERK
jgi:hypothetical protein